MTPRLRHDEAASGTLRLIEGDFLEEAPRHVADGSVDVIVTSPPYNFGVAYRTYRDDLPFEAYLAWTGRWAREAKRCLSPSGSLFLNLGGRPSSPWAAWDTAQVFRRHFVLQNVIHWIKSIAIDATGQVLGHYKPINSPRYLNDQHEYIFHFTHRGDVSLDRLAIGVPYQDKSNIGRWRAATRDRHCRGNTWFLPYETITSRQKDRPHPATFPTALPLQCMKLHGVERIRLALDPFLGLGSAALAAMELGVPFIGFEIDSVYLSIARERLASRAASIGRSNSARSRSSHG